MSVGTFCCLRYALHQAMGPDVAMCCGNDAYDFRAACSSIAQGSLECLRLLLQQCCRNKAILFLTTHKYTPYISSFGTLQLITSRYNEELNGQPGK